MRELVGKVKLELDESSKRKVDAGLKDSEKSLKDLGDTGEESGERLKQSFDNFSRSISDLTNNINTLLIDMAATGFSIFGITKFTSDFGREIESSAQAIGLTTDGLQKLRFAAAAAGVDAQTLQTGLENLSEVSRLAGKGLEQGFELVSLAVEEATTQLGQVRVATAFFGEAGRSLLPFLRAGTDQIRNFSQQAEDLGIVMTKTAIEDSRRFGAGMEFVKAILTGVRNEVGARLLPTMNDLVAQFVSFLSVNRQIIRTGIIQFVFGLSGTLRTVAFILFRIITFVVRLSRMFGGFINLLLIINSLFTIFLGFGIAAAIGAMVSAVASLVTQLAKGVVTLGLFNQESNVLRNTLLGVGILGFILLIEDLITHLEGGKSLLGSFFDGFNKQFPNIGKAFTSLISFFKQIRDFFLSGQATSSFKESMISVGRSIMAFLEPILETIDLLLEEPIRKLQQGDFLGALKSTWMNFFEFLFGQFLTLKQKLFEFLDFRNLFKDQGQSPGLQAVSLTENVLKDPRTQALLRELNERGNILFEGGNPITGERRTDLFGKLFPDLAERIELGKEFDSLIQVTKRKARELLEDAIEPTFQQIFDAAKRLEFGPLLFKGLLILRDVIRVFLNVEKVIRDFFSEGGGFEQLREGIEDLTLQDVIDAINAVIRAMKAFAGIQTFGDRVDEIFANIENAFERFVRFMKRLRDDAVDLIPEGVRDFFRSDEDEPSATGADQSGGILDSFTRGLNSLFQRFSPANQDTGDRTTQGSIQNQNSITITSPQFNIQGGGTAEENAEAARRVFEQFIRDAQSGLRRNNA